MGYGDYGRGEGLSSVGFGCFWMFQQDALMFQQLDLPPERFEAQEVPKEAGKVVASEDESEARFLGQGLGTQNILSKSHL